MKRIGFRRLKQWGPIELWIISVYNTLLRSLEIYQTRLVDRTLILYFHVAHFACHQRHYSTECYRTQGIRYPYQKRCLRYFHGTPAPFSKNGQFPWNTIFTPQLNLASRAEPARQLSRSYFTCAIRPSCSSGSTFTLSN